MIIYDPEKQLGLEDKIRSSASIFGSVSIEPNNIQTIHKLGRIEASYGDEDLYFIKSILVTAGWNLNDDVFDKYELWKAKATPVDKLLNLEHNPRQVVGHILDCYAIDDSGKRLENTLAETQIPNKFHLVTPSVVYRFLNSKDTELEKEMTQIIAEIEDGKWSVSMECLFDEFDNDA
jgi:hypothetical protein